MQLNPHLNFNGECEAAFKFYEKCLNGKITFMMPYEGTPVADHVPAGWSNKILHATLKVGDQVLTAADAPADHYQKPQGFSVMLGIKDPAGGTDISCVGREWQRADAAPGDILGYPIWYARRPVRHTMDH